MFIAIASSTAAVLCSGAAGFVFAPTFAVKVRENKLRALLSWSVASLLMAPTRRTHAMPDVCLLVGLGTTLPSAPSEVGGGVGDDGVGPRVIRVATKNMRQLGVYVQLKEENMSFVLSFVVIITRDPHDHQVGSVSVLSITEVYKCPGMPGGTEYT